MTTTHTARSWLHGLALAPFAALLLACDSVTLAQAETAGRVDLIIDGDYVLTMTNGDAPLRDGAVAVHHGEIVAVGPADEIHARFSAAETLPGRDRVVLPGLVNGHTHAAMSLLRGVADDLDLLDWLQNYIFPAEVQFVDADFVRIGTELACWEMIRGGTTTFVDMYYFPDAVANAVDRCGLRAIVVPSVIDQKSPDAEDGAQSLSQAIDFAHRWKSRNSRITPSIGAHSVYTMSPDWLKKVRAAALEAGVPVSIHVSESRYEIDVTRENYDATPVELLDGLGFFDNHTIAAHVVWPTDTDQLTLAQRRVGVIHNPSSNMKISSGISPVAEMLENGVLVGLGTDGAASNNDLDMWEEIRLAAFLQKVHTMDPKVLPAGRVLHMATAGGAQAIGLDDQIGTLQTGKRADLIQVSLADLSLAPMYDVVSHLVYVTDEHDVTSVVVDGRVLLRDKKVLTIDEAKLRREVAGLAMKIQRELVH